jgi:hypothetical protein
MLSNGLSASIWAPKHGEHYGPKPGDWPCACGASNFAKRTVCYQCIAPKGEVSGNNGHQPFGYGYGAVPQRRSSGHQNGFNQVSSGISTQTSLQLTFGGDGGQSIQHGHPVTFKRAHSNQSRSFQQADPSQFDPLDLQKYGLATSRWAPKNYRPGRQQSDEPEIWTRVCAEDFCCWKLLTRTRADRRQAQTTDEHHLPSHFEAPRPRPSIRSTTLYPRHNAKNTGRGLL